jgi:hypothetical protein
VIGHFLYRITITLALRCIDVVSNLMASVFKVVCETILKDSCEKKMQNTGTGILPGD